MEWQTAELLNDNILICSAFMDKHILQKEMIIKIKASPNSKKEEIIKEGDFYKVKVKAPAMGGRANKEVIEALADFFKVKKSSIRVLQGQKSRDKLIEVIN